MKNTPTGTGTYGSEAENTAPADILSRNAAFARLFAAPTAESFGQEARKRTIKVAVLGAVLSLLMGGLFIIEGFDSPIAPLVALILLVTPIFLWHAPRAVLYTVFGAASFLTLFPSQFSDAIVEWVPFFWNTNTIVQIYGHANFKAIPLNLLEVFLLVAGVCSFVRAVYENKVQIHKGPLLIPVLGYLAFVLLAWANGMVTGGDFKESLQEVRSQIYFAIAYFLAANLITDRRHERNLLVIAMIGIGIKGILLTFRRYVTIGGQPLPDQGVGSHEEAFFFSFFVLALLVFWLYKSYRGLQWMAWAFLPTVILGNLALNRRAGTAAMLIALPIVMLIAYCTLPKYRRVIGILGVILGTSGFFYYQTFKNSESAFAQPARAIRSQFAPDARDASSNMYRDAENADQMATLRSSPIIGYGYGKRFFHAVPIADISNEYEWWDLLPHNQILWVWMRTGTLGFLAFWLMISAIIIRACRLARMTSLDAASKSVIVLCVCTTVLLLVFGLLDLQMSNFRNMLFAGYFAGIISTRLYPSVLAEEKAKKDV